VNEGSISVYYRIYTESGLVLSKSAAGTGDRSLGRIIGMAVTPPHTVLSLKKCLCRVEGFKDGQTMELFDSCTAQSPMDDKSTISLLTESGPGSSQHKPLALVVSPPFEGGGLSAIRCLQDFVTESEPRYRTQPSIACVRHTIHCNLSHSVLCTVPRNRCGPLQETRRTQ
jgi:hypothetical protein